MLSEFCLVKTKSFTLYMTINKCLFMYNNSNDNEFQLSFF